MVLTDGHKQILQMFSTADDTIKRTVSAGEDLELKYTALPNQLLSQYRRKQAKDLADMDIVGRVDVGKVYYILVGEVTETPEPQPELIAIAITDFMGYVEESRLENRRAYQRGYQAKLRKEFSELRGNQEPAKVVEWGENDV